MLPKSITVDDLMNNRYKSTPRNKVVADFCKDLGLIEKYGSGIRWVVIFFFFEDEGLPLPKFEQMSGGVNVTVYASQKADKVGDRVGGHLSENPKKILDLMRQKPSLSALTIKNATL